MFTEQIQDAAHGHMQEVRDIILQLDARVKQAYAEGFIINFTSNDPDLEMSVHGVNHLFAADKVRSLQLGATLVVRQSIALVEQAPVDLTPAEPEPEQPELPFEEPVPEPEEVTA